MQGTERIRQICFESTLAPYTPQTITDPEALIAELMTVRRRGYAVDDEEELMGIFCVGAPFFGHSGSCAGALSVTGIKKSLPQWKLAELGGLLRNLADEASQFLGGPRFDQLPTGQFSQELTQAAEHETAGPGRQKSSLWGR
jgi:IclR family acetate operon transcriptional repressor